MMTIAMSAAVTMTIAGIETIAMMTIAMSVVTIAMMIAGIADRIGMITRRDYPAPMTVKHGLRARRVLTITRPVRPGPMNIKPDRRGLMIIKRGRPVMMSARPARRGTGIAATDAIGMTRVKRKEPACRGLSSRWVNE